VFVSFLSFSLSEADETDVAEVASECSELCEAEDVDCSDWCEIDNLADEIELPEVEGVLPSWCWVPRESPPDASSVVADCGVLEHERVWDMVMYSGTTCG
jgi:hypothetical protein